MKIDGPLGLVGYLILWVLLVQVLRRLDGGKGERRGWACLFRNPKCLAHGILLSEKILELLVLIVVAAAAGGPPARVPDVPANHKQIREAPEPRRPAGPGDVRPAAGLRPLVGAGRPEFLPPIGPAEAGAGARRRPRGQRANRNRADLLPRAPARRRPRRVGPTRRRCAGVVAQLEPLRPS